MSSAQEHLSVTHFSSEGQNGECSKRGGGGSWSAGYTQDPAAESGVWKPTRMEAAKGIHSFRIWKYLPRS